MLQALGNKVIIKPVWQEKEGGIILLSGLGEWKQYDGFVYGIVISTGPDFPFKDEIKAGDKIIFRRHEGKRIWFERELYLALRLRWVEAKII